MSHQGFSGQWLKSRVIVVAFACAIVLTLALPFTHAAQIRCRSVHGKLLDEHIESGVTVATMIGGITGDYTYTLGTIFPADAGHPNLIYVTGTSEVETKNGTLSFFETSTQDTAEPGDLNGTVLMTITGGTGKWQGANGHLVLVGFFHQDTLTGEWDYQGEICTPK